MPVCAICAAPATCWGSYEDGPLGFACDTCCRHGCEDGHCEPVGASTFPVLLAEIQEARADTDKVRDALAWVESLKASGNSICAYCKAAVGPEAIEEHIRACEKHPMTAMRERAETAEAAHAVLLHDMESVDQARKERNEAVARAEQAEGELKRGHGVWPQSLTELEKALGTFPAGREFLRKLNRAVEDTA